MAIEIERKFLVSLSDATALLVGLEGVKLQQGYIAKAPMLVRIRLSADTAWLTLKSTDHGISRAEFEYVIPLQEGKDLYANHATLGVLSKTRYKIPFEGHVFEVDVYDGALSGLVTAEVEMNDVNEEVKLPLWLGREVSDEIRYSNEYLARFGLPT